MTFHRSMAPRAQASFSLAMILLAMSTLAAGMPSAYAQTVGCFLQKQPIAIQHCYGPADVGKAEQTLVFHPIRPTAAVRAVTHLDLSRVITFQTESAAGGHGTNYSITYVFGSIPQGRHGVLVPSGTHSAYVAVTEILEHPASSAVHLERGSGALGLFRTRASKKPEPWSATAPLSSPDVTLYVTANTSRARVAAIASRILRSSDV